MEMDEAIEVLETFLLEISDFTGMVTYGMLRSFFKNHVFPNNNNNYNNSNNYNNNNNNNNNKERGPLVFVRGVKKLPLYVKTKPPPLHKHSMGIGLTF